MIEREEVRNFFATCTLLPPADSSFILDVIASSMGSINDNRVSGGPAPTAHRILRFRSVALIRF